MTEYKKHKDGSYVHNCYIERRIDDMSKYMFYQSNDEYISAFLNGYAIIPLEKYYKLIDKEFPDQDKENIIEADKQLYKEE